MPVTRLSFATSSFSSTSTLTKRTPKSRCSAARALRAGPMAWHGPHHAAVKYTTSTPPSFKASSNSAFVASFGSA